MRRTSAADVQHTEPTSTLLNDFQQAGGRIETVEFHTPADLATLKQKVVINCTGYGARALWKDESIVPVRGQIAWLIPQPEVTYGLAYYNRRRHCARATTAWWCSTTGPDESYGYNDANEAPDRAEAEAAVAAIAPLSRPAATAPGALTYIRRACGGLRRPIGAPVPAPVRRWVKASSQERFPAAAPPTRKGTNHKLLLLLHLVQPLLVLVGGRSNARRAGRRLRPRPGCETRRNSGSVSAARALRTETPTASWLSASPL